VRRLAHLLLVYSATEIKPNSMYLQVFIIVFCRWLVIAIAAVISAASELWTMASADCGRGPACTAKHSSPVNHCICKASATVEEEEEEVLAVADGLCAVDAIAGIMTWNGDVACSV